MKVVLLFFFCSVIYGQQLHHQMLSAQGKTLTTPKGLKVSQTVAQQSVIGTSIANKSRVIQGFQQSKISNAAKVVNATIATTVYPNPITDFVNFKFSAPVTGAIQFSLYDVHGRLLYHQEKEATDNLLTIKNLQLAAGEYFVKLDANKYSFGTTILKSK